MYIKVKNAGMHACLHLDFSNARLYKTDVSQLHVFIIVNYGREQIIAHRNKCSEE